MPQKIDDPPVFIPEDNLADIIKTQSTPSWIGFSLIFLSFFPIAILLLLGFGLKDKSTIIPLVTSTLLAVSTPIVLISIRHFVRLARLRLIDLFDKSFKNVEWDKIASFESIKAKYLTDIPGVKENTIDLDLLPSLPFSLPADWMLLLCSLPFIIFSWLAFFILFAPVSALEGGHLVNSSLLLHADDSESTSLLATIALSAFAGAYFYSMNILIRSIASFDMSPITFIRAFVQLVFASILSIVLWRAANQIAGILPNFVYDQLPTNSHSKAKDFWILFAFALGSLPDGAIQLVLKRSGLEFKGINNKITSLYRRS